MKKFGVAFHLKYWYSSRPFYQKLFLITLETYIAHAFPISICQLGYHKGSTCTSTFRLHVFENHEEKKRKGGGHKPKIIFTTEWQFAISPLSKFRKCKHAYHVIL